MLIFYPGKEMLHSACPYISGPSGASRPNEKQSVD